MLCERKPSWMRATATLADRTLRSILMLMTETDDDPEWHNADEVRASTPTQLLQLARAHGRG